MKIRDLIKSKRRKTGNGFLIKIYEEQGRNKGYNQIKRKETRDSKHIEKGEKRRNRDLIKGKG